MDKQTSSSKAVEASIELTDSYPSCQSNGLPWPQESQGLEAEFYLRGFSSLPWINMDTAPQVFPLQELGEGTYGKVDLVIYDGEVLVRKQFKGSYDLTEAYALTMLQGAGGTPLLKGVIEEPLTLFMSYCGMVTLEDFLEGKPSCD